MNEDVFGNTSISGNDSIAPTDGLEREDDLFAGAERPEELPRDPADGLSDEAFLLAQLNEESTAEADPTTDAPEADEPNAEAAEAPATEEPSPEPVRKQSRILTAKVNHKDVEVNVDESTDDDIVTWFQKAAAFDRMQEAKAKETYRRVYQEQLDSGMSEGVAKLVAAAASDGKAYPLTDEESEEPEAPAIPDDDRIAQLFEELGAMKDRMNAMVKQTNETVAAYQKENNILKQNAAAAAKAPVKPVSGGGDVTPAKEDPWLKGFDMERW